MKTYIKPSCEQMHMAVSTMIAVSAGQNGLDGAEKQEYTGNETVDWSRRRSLWDDDEE